METAPVCQVGVWLDVVDLVISRGKGHTSDEMDMPGFRPGRRRVVLG